MAREALDGEGLERDGLQGLVSALTIDQLESSRACTQLNYEFKWLGALARQF